MRVLIITTVNLLFWGITHSQKMDNFWITGRGGGSQTPLNDKWGSMIFDFNKPNGPNIEEHQEYNMNFTITNASICDSTGNLLFYTNGEKIYHKNHTLMENGNGIATWDGLGYRIPQGAVILPYPEHPNQFMLLTLESNTGEALGRRLYYHRIDMNQNNGLGKVVEKRQILVSDSLYWGKLTAVKHANGRDWWFVFSRKFGSLFYVGLLSPSGFTVKSVDIGVNILKGFGQAVFTPDGTKYVRSDDNDLLTPAQVSIFDFDRCTGELSNFRTDTITSPGSNFGAGCAVSPDSRYLYVFHTEIVVQYDLTAPDIFATRKTIAYFDGTPSGIYGAYFLLAQLAPDGRIYVASWTSTRHWHLMNFPSREGEDCQFLQHHFSFPVVVDENIPNLPNYRLGPLDGSPCDTLGIDNYPLANYRWEQEDSTDILRVTFTDLSSYEPDSWTWDFGDGAGSTERYPLHQYDTAGIYTACLIVKNEYSADTFCQVLLLGVQSGTMEAASGEAGISISPNPFGERFNVVVNPALGACDLRLYDQLGREVLNSVLRPGSNHIEAGGLEPGLYFYHVKAGGKWLVAGKLCKG